MKELKEFMIEHKALTFFMIMGFLGYLGAFICTIIMLIMYIYETY